MFEIKKDRYQSRKKVIFIISGEPSGDILGGELIKSLKASGRKLSFIGIGGRYMLDQGLRTIFPMGDLSVVGLGEIFPHIPKLLKRFYQTVEKIKNILPDIIVTIDSPDFSFRLSKNLKKHDSTKNIPIIHYVAPTVWAWREERSKKIAKVVNHLMTLFPFEAKYFRRHGLKTTFVGHPIFDKRLDPKNAVEAFKNKNKITGNPLLCLLPGSRRSEITKLMPIYLETIKLLAEKYPGLALVIPILSKTRSVLQRSLGKITVPYHLVTDSLEKDLAIRSSDLALATSGTVSLELSLLKKPHVIAYKLNPITFKLIKAFAKVDFVTIVNIVAKREVVPEFLQERCQANELFSALDSLIRNKRKRTEQISSIVSVLKKIKKNKNPASFNAAQVVLEYCK